MIQSLEACEHFEKLSKP